jgi:hypothetical protein
MPKAPRSARDLRVYSFDPSRAGKSDCETIVHLPYEPLEPGPVGKRVAVIDYDPGRGIYYDPVDLDEPQLLGDSGLPADDSNPQFHQQMVYGVVMETLRRFEFALGRRVRWRTERTKVLKGFHHGKLRIFPHAMEEANAFYDPELKALLFGYFRAEKVDGASTLPGQVVFTCLSHDIVAHETTHAILDGIRAHFIESTSDDTPAFHEAFADIVALLQHFSLSGVLLDAVQRTRGQIYQNLLSPEALSGREGAQRRIRAEWEQDNPLIELAKQFGEAMGNRSALRSALGTVPDPEKLETETEPHGRGSILVAAVFDAFFSVYVQRTQDLLRMTYPDGRLPMPNFLNADLAARMADEACKTASRILTICVRALDYCPPVDLQFGDYLRAIVTADMDAAPDDGAGYRAALIDAFRARGIRPEGVQSYSEHALRWEKLEGPALPEDLFVRQFDMDHAKSQDLRDRKTHEFYASLWEGMGRNRSALNLVQRHKLSIGSVNMVQRVRPDGMFQRLMVCELMQQKEEWVDSKNRDLGTFTFRGGSTVIVDSDGRVEYAIGKRLDDAARLQRQREYWTREMAGQAARAYLTDKAVKPDFSIRAIHRGD